MFDRLITSAGALSDAADRAVRGVVRGPATALRPVSLVVAGACLALAGLLLLGALETRVERAPLPIAAGTLASVGLGPRTQATIDGSLVSSYLEYYDDLDLDGSWDDGEPLVEWNYFLVDPDTRSGLTVVSTRPPAEVFTTVASGEVVQDAIYIAADLDAFQAVLDQHDLDLDRTRYIDTTRAGGGATHDLATDLPSPGSAITVQGSRSAEYVPICSSDADGDDECDDDEVDRYDVLVYDLASRRAVVVSGVASPEFVPMTMSGIVRDDPDTVRLALAGPDDPTAEWELDVSPSLVLHDGATPGSGWILVIVAAGLTVLAGLLVLGAVGGGVRFRRAAPAVEAVASGRAPLGPDEAIPLRVTGRLHGRSGDLLVREAAADLVPFALTAAGRDGPMTLLVQRRGRPEGLPVGPSDLVGPPERGSVASLRSERPAVRLTTTTGPIILTFDEAASRDRAAAALMPATSPVPTEEATGWTPGN